MSKCEKLRVISIPLFDFDVGVFESLEHYQTYFAEVHSIDAPEVTCFTAAAVYFEDGGASWFSLILPDGVSIAKLAHEACHMADFAMSAAGVPTGVKNTEVRGYLVERIMEQLLDGGQ